MRRSAPGILATLLAGIAMPSQAEAAPFRFEQRIVSTAQRDAAVSLRWELTDDEFRTLVNRLGTMFLVREKKGVLVPEH